MKADDLRKFLEMMGWTDIEMERRTGVNRKTLRKYKREGAPKWLALAGAALAMNLPPWGEKDRG